jgi:hypothetical protein
MARRNRKRKPRAGGPTPPVKPGAKSGTRAVGARVARVAVDDETWAAFRELCGTTPASVRLGDLVRAEVTSARGARDPAGDALRSLRAITDQAHALEDYIRSQGRGAT